MGIQAGVGVSHHRNPKVAGQEAATKALEAAGVENARVRASSPGLRRTNRTFLSA
jgi:hypothetical protein